MIEVNIAGPHPHTDDEISLVDFANTFAAATNSLDMPEIHLAGAATVWGWLCEMRAAAEAEQPGEVARLARLVTDKIALERSFADEDARRFA
jgi:hypothetical protein